MTQSRKSNKDHIGRSAGYHHIEPLRHLEADVPLPYYVESVTETQSAVEMNVGQLVFVAADGTVTNETGSPLFRLTRADT